MQQSQIRTNPTKIIMALLSFLGIIHIVVSASKALFVCDCGRTEMKVYIPKTGEMVCRHCATQRISSKQYSKQQYSKQEYSKQQV